MIEFLRSHFADAHDATIDTLLRHLDNERIADQRVTMWITSNPSRADSFLPIRARPRSHRSFRSNVAQKSALRLTARPFQANSASKREQFLPGKGCRQGLELPDTSHGPPQPDLASRFAECLRGEYGYSQLQAIGGFVAQ